MAKARPGHHQREHQVELLLDGQRPEVQHGRRRLEQLGVRRTVGDEAPVGHVDRARPSRRPGGSPLVGVATVAANTNTPTRQTSTAGMSRRARRAQKRRARWFRCGAVRVSSSVVIRNPERVKKVETPRKPPPMPSRARRGRPGRPAPRPHASLRDRAGRRSRRGLLVRSVRAGGSSVGTSTRHRARGSSRGGHRRRVPAPAGRHPCGSRLVVRLGVAVS